MDIWGVYINFMYIFKILIKCEGKENNDSGYNIYFVI